MIVESERTGYTYKVMWQESGYSYATPVIVKKRKYWFDKKEYVGRGIARKTVELMHKEDLEKWFLETVHEYEAWATSWGKELVYIKPDPIPCGICRGDQFEQAGCNYPECSTRGIK